MPNRKMDITRDVRVKIKTLHEHTGLTHAQIAKKCKVSRSAVTKLLKRLRETGSISPTRAGNCGRKKLTTIRQDRLLLRESKKNARLSSNLLRKHMLPHGIQLSSRTVRRRLLEFDRPARRMVRKPILTRAMKKRRLEFAKAHRNWTVDDWKKVSVARN